MLCNTGVAYESLSCHAVCKYGSVGVQTVLERVQICKRCFKKIKNMQELGDFSEE